MLVNGIIIHRAILKKFLLRLPGKTEKDVDLLLNPADHQNVPSALNLLTAIHAVTQLEVTAFTPPLQPTEYSELRVLKVVGSLWDSFVQSLVNPDYSLERQLQALSKFAHLSYALFSLHGPSAITGQLYGDNQAFVKAAFVCVAKQKVADGSLPFYLYQLGSDRLEELFSDIRSQSHDRNCDILELADRLSISAEDLQIYGQHPEWSRPSRRRTFTGSEIVDHANPAYFKADYTADNANIERAWARGRTDAEQMLGENHVTFNFDAALGSDPDVDFLRPAGGHKYPGVSTDVDRSSEELDAATEGDLDGVEFEDEGACNDVVDIQLDDLLDDPDEIGQVLTSQDKTATASSASDWMDWPISPDGRTRNLHVTSILAAVCQSDGKQSSDRLIRVKVFSDHYVPPPHTTGNLCGDHAFLVGDIVACPVRVLDQVYGGLMKILGITKKGVRASFIDEGELQGGTGSDIHVSGQLMVMREMSLSDSRGDVATRKWTWLGEFASLSSATSKSSKAPNAHTSRKAHTVKSPASFIQPIPDLSTVPSSSFPETSRRILDSNNLPDALSITQEQLDSVMSRVLDKESDKLDGYVAKLPKYGCSGDFPYCSPSDGASSQLLLRTPKSLITSSLPFLASPFFLLREIQSCTTGRTEGDKFRCPRCNHLMDQSKARPHMGMHILRALLGIVEPGVDHSDKVCCSHSPTYVSRLNTEMTPLLDSQT